ncbi:MAG TPA: 50S ribosomal protein L29 [Candidatus Omnitrophota bacterium]|jgi:large subunit ribosomal protein L29|nr:50S ribosomal protein L29 [Candidatus Omnitrophota bacterium]
MSKVKVKDIRNLSASELDQKKDGLEKELFELRQKRVTGQLDKPHRFKQIRRQIAQINTVKRESKNG